MTVILAIMGISGEMDDSLEIAVRDGIRRGPALVDREEIERIASDLHRRAGRSNAESLAVIAGCEVRPHPHRGIATALLSNGTIWVYSDPDPRRVELAVFFGLAHWLLRVVHYSSADAWRLALALAMPAPPQPTIAVSDVCSTVQIPLWAIEIRLRILVTRPV